MKLEITLQHYNNKIYKTIILEYVVDYWSTQFDDNET